MDECDWQILAGDLRENCITLFDSFSGVQKGMLTKLHSMLLLHSSFAFQLQYYVTEMPSAEKRAINFLFVSIASHLLQVTTNHCELFAQIRLELVSTFTRVLRDLRQSSQPVPDYSMITSLIYIRKSNATNICESYSKKVSDVLTMHLINVGSFYPEDGRTRR